MKPSYHKTIVKEYFTLLGLVVISIIVVLVAVWLLVRTPQQNNTSIPQLKTESSSYQSGVPATRSQKRGRSSRLRYRIQLPSPTLNYDQGDISYFSGSEGFIPEQINSNSGFKLDVSKIRGNVPNIGSSGRSEASTTPAGSGSTAPTPAPSSTTPSAL